MMLPTLSLYLHIRPVKKLSTLDFFSCHWLLLLLLLHPFNGLFSRTTWVSRYQKGKTNLDLNVARDYGVLGCSGISLTICRQSAPRSRQITSRTPKPTPTHATQLPLILLRLWWMTYGVMLSELGLEDGQELYVADPTSPNSLVFRLQITAAMD